MTDCNDTVYQLRMKKAQKAEWKERAKRAGLSLSNWIKWRCDDTGADVITKEPNVMTKQKDVITKSKRVITPKIPDRDVLPKDNPALMSPFERARRGL